MNLKAAENFILMSFRLRLSRSTRNFLSGLQSRKQYCKNRRGMFFFVQRPSGIEHCFAFMELSFIWSNNQNLNTKCYHMFFGLPSGGARASTTKKVKRNIFAGSNDHFQSIAIIIWNRFLLSLLPRSRFKAKQFLLLKFEVERDTKKSRGNWFLRELKHKSVQRPKTRREAFFRKRM